MQPIKLIHLEHALKIIKQKTEEYQTNRETIRVLLSRVCSKYFIDRESIKQ